ncbi:MAG TPA: acetyl-CoA carboxylase biotin carboxyl carrier protein [Candidatus Omnitrophota bacterium]|nr:acetyl-CoA carboxylase biotin carboxyl carrier protein [Candidatus Omnitrophota bacterium]
MNIKEIKEMIQLMNENNLSEIEMEKEGEKIRLKKSASGAIEQTVIQERPVQYAQASRPAAEPAKPAAAAKATIKSPMVGTFYSAPAPDAQPFVQPGTQVEVGQVICIIEAMKLMNEIKAEVRGKIAQVLVNNGDPVEFGQVLFVLE